MRGAARDTPLAIKRRRLFWPFVAPSLTFLAVFYIGPLLFGIWTSLHKWDGYSAMEWNGLGSYRTLVDDPFFRTSMLNTFKILVFVGVAVFVLAFALTMVLREMAGRRFVRAVIFFPHIVNAMVFGVSPASCSTRAGWSTPRCPGWGWTTRPSGWAATTSSC